jgi:tRNA threonylcarbamoyladenosine biosynthesis protein TsaB
LGVAVDSEPQLSLADTLVDGAAFELGIYPAGHILLALAKDMLGKDQLVWPAKAQPIYVRNKVAQTTNEREAIKAKAVAEQVIPAQAGIHG